MKAKQFGNAVAVRMQRFVKRDLRMIGIGLPVILVASIIGGIAQPSQPLIAAWSVFGTLTGIMLAWVFWPAAPDADDFIEPFMGTVLAAFTFSVLFALNTAALGPSLLLAVWLSLGICGYLLAELALLADIPQVFTAGRKIARKFKGGQQA